MSLRSSLLLSFVLLTLAGTGCARRNRAAPDAVSTSTKVKTKTKDAAAPAPTAEAEVRRNNVRDLAMIMTEELELRDEQTLRIRQVLASTVEQVNAAQAKFGTDRAGLINALKQINGASEAQLKQIMTPEQYKQYQQRKPQIQAKLREQQQQK